jgi:hypothetical protein
MKKVIFSVVTILCICFSYSSFAIFGISINFKKGTKEWNGDHTGTECVGRGICEFTISALAQTPTTLGPVQSGNLGFSVTQDFFNSEKMQDYLVNGRLHIGATIELTEDVKRELAKMGFDNIDVIKAGDYGYKLVKDVYEFDLGVR